MKIRNNRGLTLIALIITIIVLLILTAVSVKLVIDKDILEDAQNTADKASQQYSNQEKKEEEAMTSWDEVPGGIIKSSTTP